MFRRVGHETTASGSARLRRRRLRRRSLSAARPGATPAGPELIERRAVEFSVAAPPSAARKLINGIASANDQFFIMRTLHVKNQKEKGPPRESPTPGPRLRRWPRPFPIPLPLLRVVQPRRPVGAIQFIVGNEHLDLSARVELIDFIF